MRCMPLTCALQLLYPGLQVMGVGFERVVCIAEALHVCFQLVSSCLRLRGCGAPSACLLLCLLQSPCSDTFCVTTLPVCIQRLRMQAPDADIGRRHNLQT